MRQRPRARHLVWIRPRAEDGFTLIELLVVVVILGFISAALMAAITIGLRTSDQTQTRMTESHDAQLVAAYFLTDVQSATSVSTSDTACAGQAPLVRFRWTDAGTQTDVAYILRAVSGERRLTRRSCVGAGAATDIDVAHVVHATTDPVVSCPSSCSGSPSKATITVTEASGYSFAVTGARRAA